MKTTTARVSPGSIAGLRSSIDEQRAPAANVAALPGHKPTALTPSSSATGREEPAIFDRAQRSSTVERSRSAARSGDLAEIPAGAKSVMKMLLTRNYSLGGFSPQRSAEIGTAFEKAHLAGSLDWNEGLPRALLGRFFAAVDLPSAQPDGNKYTAYVFVGRDKTDPNDATEVYITRVGARKDHVRLSVASDGASDANSAQTTPRRSPAEQLWKETHGVYPDQSTTIMAKSNWSFFKIDFPD